MHRVQERPVRGGVRCGREGRNLQRGQRLRAFPVSAEARQEPTGTALEQGLRLHEDQSRQPSARQGVHLRQLGCLHGVPQAGQTGQALLDLPG